MELFFLWNWQVFMFSLGKLIKLFFFLCTMLFGFLWAAWSFFCNWFAVESCPPWKTLQFAISFAYINICREPQGLNYNIVYFYTDKRIYFASLVLLFNAILLGHREKLMFISALLLPHRKISNCQLILHCTHFCI